jgi:hypothetical protein
MNHFHAQTNQPNYYQKITMKYASFDINRTTRMGVQFDAKTTAGKEAVSFWSPEPDPFSPSGRGAVGTNCPSTDYRTRAIKT